MNLPNFKDVLKKLSIFKNKSLLIPVIIAMVGILLFIPTQLMSSSLKKKVQKESISNGLTKVNNLKRKAVSDELLQLKEDQLEIRANDANEIKLLSLQTTQRQFLSNDILDVNDPNSLSSLIFLQFGQRYIGGINKLITDTSAGDCPTREELARAIEESGVNSRSRTGRTGTYDSRARTPIPTRMEGMGYESSDSYQGIRIRGELEKVIINQVCQKRAAEVSFYVNPTNISGYNFWSEYDINVLNVYAVEDCWYYQLAYWVIEDIFDTLDSFNSQYDNVINAPAKRLMSLSFKIDRTRSGRSTRSRSRRSSGNKGTADDDRPNYVIETNNGTMLTETCTGRYCNDDIDVIHFNVVCVVGIKDIMPFIKELCSAKEHQYIDESGQTHTYKHNQITVLEAKSTSVNKDSADHNCFHYGDSGVVELELVCEYIFNKNAYEKYKPESVKQALAE
jgi:hypothetical protein